MEKYIHEECAHNLEDPQIIVPIIMEALKPNSVVDVGCGIGTFLHVFKENGIKDYVGLDGHWVNKDKLSKYIPIDHFQEIDLEKDFKIVRKFDLAICVEVVEHLDEKTGDLIVRNLTQLSDSIVFSAAIPGQFGQNHLNEQWPDYWMKKFDEYDYIFLDVFRPILWNKPSIKRWYKQNMFLVVKKEKSDIIGKFTSFFDEKISSYVHPEYFELRVNNILKLTKINNVLIEQLEEITKGRKSFKIYFLLIAKFFLRRIRLYK